VRVRGLGSSEKVEGLWSGVESWIWLLLVAGTGGVEEGSAYSSRRMIDDGMKIATIATVMDEVSSGSNNYYSYRPVPSPDFHPITHALLLSNPLVLLRNTP